MSDLCSYTTVISKSCPFLPVSRHQCVTGRLGKVAGVKNRVFAIILRKRLIALFTGQSECRFITQQHARRIMSIGRQFTAEMEPKIAAHDGRPTSPFQQLQIGGHLSTPQANDCTGVLKPVGVPFFGRIEKRLMPCFLAN